MYAKYKKTPLFEGKYVFTKKFVRCLQWINDKNLARLLQSAIQTHRDLLFLLEEGDCLRDLQIQFKNICFRHERNRTL